jgi:hypothetical protein
VIEHKLESVVLDAAGTKARTTPWDARVFNVGTAEILDFAPADEAAAIATLNAFAEWGVEKHIGFCYTRVDAHDMPARRALQTAGFYAAETTFNISKRDLQKTDFSKYLRRGVNPSAASDLDLPALSQLAHDHFDHSRFHDDPFVSATIARQRYAGWINDLKAKEISIFRYRETLVGLHVQELDIVNPQTMHLILTGVAKPVAVLATAWWAAALDALKARNITHCSTVVSAANVGVLNLYNQFGFRIEKTLIGYHKFLR